MKEYRYLSGSIGSIIIVCGAFISSIPYIGEAGQRYSILNFFISELGDLQKSTFPWAFNLGLITGSILLFYFSLSVGHFIGNKKGQIIGTLGALASIFSGLVGFIPQNYFIPHATVALGFFGSGLLVVTTMMILTLTNKIEFPKWTLIPAMAVIICFITFLTTPSPLFIAWFKNPETWVRPEIWPKAIMEWSCLIAMLIWIISISIHLHYSENLNAQKPPEQQCS